MNRAVGTAQAWLRQYRVESGAVCVYAIFKIAYALQSVHASGRLGPRIIEGADSGVYTGAASAPIWSWKFLAGPGPFGYPLLIKLCASNIRAVILAQSLISIVAWISST